MTTKEAAEILRSRNGYARGFPQAVEMGLKALDTIESLKTQIADLKHNIKSGNSDYLTGYLFALSMVEGMIANETHVSAEQCQPGRAVGVWEAKE